MLNFAVGFRFIAAVLQGVDMLGANDKGRINPVVFGTGDKDFGIALCPDIGRRADRDIDGIRLAIPNTGAAFPD